MEAVEAGHAAACSRSGRVGRPKKYAQPWVSLTKRVYLEEGTFSSLRFLKAQNQFNRLAILRAIFTVVIVSITVCHFLRSQMMSSTRELSKIVNYVTSKT